ncbi:MAG: glycosyltransferase, partial [Bacteroidetes bacterium]|nr:glycosyltransferase [Bacteroidota bacterium]
MAESIFWIATILLVYNYLLYPLFLRLIVAGRSQNSQVFLTDNELPKLSILIPAFNEERVIHSKIESIYQSQYPIDNYEVIIGSDNSTDRTNEIIQELQEEYRNLKLHVFEHRTGKPGIINKLVEEAQGDILVLTDADVELNNDCLFQMLKHFKNPDIGLVDTNMMSRSSYNDGISYQESTYVRFEVKIKHWEGIAWGSMMGPFGGCYALRKDYYTPVPDNYVVDDFFIAMNVLIKGKKCINELEAKCYEQTSVQIQEEFRRKIRISAGNFQNLGTFVNLLFKPFSAIGFTFLSHKVFRWFGFDDLLVIHQQGDAEFLHHLRGNLGLHHKNVVNHPDITLRPKLGVVGNSDELGRDADLVITIRAAIPAHRAIENIVDAEVTGDLFDGLAGSVILRCAGTRDNTEPTNRGQPAGNFFGHARSKIGLFGRSEILKRQHHQHFSFGGSFLLV